MPRICVAHVAAAAASAASGVFFATAAANPEAKPTYRELIRAEAPIAFWDFEGLSAAEPASGPDSPRRVANDAPAEPGDANALSGSAEGAIEVGVPGPRGGFGGVFPAENRALKFRSGGVVRVPDPGEDSPLDFGLGESLTLEAWVNLDAIGEGQNVYIVGKGRTQNPRRAAHNQNYALRLRGTGAGEAALSFLFRGERNQTDADWHRWTSSATLAAGSSWHHVAVTYTFGRPGSLRGFLDGRPAGGSWDMGGATTAGPVVDDDELWIGTSMGRSGNSTFRGSIDAVAIHRRALAAADFARRVNVPAPELAAPDVAEPPAGGVRVEIVEGLPDKTSWSALAAIRGAAPTDAYTEPAFGFGSLPPKYGDGGVRVDRSNPFLLRASARVELAPGPHRIVVRSRGATRLWVNGQPVLTTPFAKRNASGHEDVPDLESELPPGHRATRPGQTERAATVTSDGRAHLVVLEAVIGGKGLRTEVGELAVATAAIAPSPADDGADKPAKGAARFHLLAPAAAEPPPFTDRHWEAYAAGQRSRLRELAKQRRRAAAKTEDDYWERRHEAARAHLLTTPAPPPPEVPDGFPVHNAIDRFIGARIAANGKTPAALADDFTFLRRAALDLTGTIPSPEEIATFQKSPGGARQRRAAAIDRLLESEGWAHHWVGYWQDVLAENPGILKPKLNNTGPFRWWIHESFEDNKPVDRFATELVMMKGSLYYGGPAGFGMASQNDVPMAAKAQILSGAFLGMEMKCARCHDAPYHAIAQEDLFSLAAMLKRAPQKVPASSSIPADSGVELGRLVEVTLKPGSAVKPAWPFPGLLAAGDVPAGTLRDPGDSRERLAALLTAPGNPRFARVIANRVWKRYTGRGLVEPADDWEEAEPSHPALLDHLARELVLSGYDLKHLARLILNSHTYQRASDPDRVDLPGAKQPLFAAPARRRLSAEQIVDSLFAASGKPFGAEEMNLDVDGRRPVNDFLNLGRPERAWQFTSLSNERDRPALSMPVAQGVVDLLDAFGWRQSRQSPLTEREGAANVLQPAALANGAAARRAAQLSEGAAMTELALREGPVEDLVEATFLRVLSRPPDPSELARMVEHLTPGYTGRILDPPATPDGAGDDAGPHAVSWSNHLSPEATRIKLEMEKRALAGDPPTERLDPAWRERMEDLVWALTVTPEFIFTP